MNNRRWGRRVTYRPSKASGAFGLVFGCIFVLIGIFVIIPPREPSACFGR